MRNYLTSMKIYYGSDLHLEFAPADFDIPTGDILILAGDIFTPHNILDIEPSRNAHKFFKEVSKKFKHVYIILGNHEHYLGFLVDTREEAEMMLEPYPNIKILDGEKVIHEDIAIFGGTLWTDYDGKNPISMWDAKQCMNDFVDIGFSADRINLNTMLPGGIDPEDFYKENLNYRKLIHNFVETNADKKKVIVTHHAPSYACCPEQYRGDSLNGAYFNTRLDHLFDYHITWIHGHIHMRYLMEYGEGVIMANPRGYPKEIKEPYQFKKLEMPE